MIPAKNRKRAPTDVRFFVVRLPSTCTKWMAFAIIRRSKFMTLFFPPLCDRNVSSWHRRFDEWPVRFGACIGRLAGVNKPRDLFAAVTRLAAAATRGNKLIALSMSAHCRPPTAES